MKSLVFYKSNSEGEDDPMLSSTIIPMMTRVEILVPTLGVRGALMSLLDLGCTQCLIRLQIVGKVGLRLRKLRQSMLFSQLDGSLTGGVPALTGLIDPVRLRAGIQEETICFIVAAGMT